MNTQPCLYLLKRKKSLCASSFTHSKLKESLTPTGDVFFFFFFLQPSDQWQRRDVYIKARMCACMRVYMCATYAKRGRVVPTTHSPRHAGNMRVALQEIILWVRHRKMKYSKQCRRVFRPQGSRFWDHKGRCWGMCGVLSYLTTSRNWKCILMHMSYKSISKSDR